ncbi:MAG: hypothetical protein AAFP83_08590 [Bacteroidota bacterium]
MNLIKQILLSLLLICTFSALFAQKLSLTEIDMPLSKEASKAAKKGELFNGGTFLSEDGQRQYNFYLFKPKGKDLMYDVITLDVASGQVKSTQTEAYTLKNLSQYNLSAQSELSDGEEGKQNLSGRAFGYMKRPILAGPPTLIKGTFSDKYVNGVWGGYDFDKKGDQKLEERFWPDFSFSVGEGVNNQEHLLRKRTTLGRLLAGNKNYIPMDGKAYVGGLMATSGVDMFLTGIFDMQTMRWDHKVESKLAPGLQHLDYHIDAQGHVHSLLSAEPHFLLVEFDEMGNKVNQLALSIPKSPNYSYTTFKLFDLDDALFVIGSHVDKPGTGAKAGLSITQVQDGKEVFHVMHDYESISNALNAAPKNKGKFKPTMRQEVESIHVLPNGDYLILYNNGFMPVHNYAMQLSPSGALKTTYQVDAIENDGSPNNRLETGSTHLPTLMLPAKDGTCYLIIRTVPQALDKGVQVSSTRGNSFEVIRTVRIDELYAYGKIVKINPKDQSITNVIAPDQVLAGEVPGELLPNGSLMLHTLDTKKKKRVKLLVK